MERRGEGASGEQLLFYGTTAPRGRAVCLQGFLGPLRCRGVPFAVTAALAAQELHSPTSADGTKCILVAKVLTGSPALDRSRRPALHIFSAEDAYPLYLLTCRRLGAA
ncbi:protein mono-ADP-ribosyltransferase PARP10 [Phasianus colchicus]|uniref:protein mono-ADP-ribosyltransferase PARP10 n=1 Tax=Phasianus colchicus TaxID=9054 RepID=UPI00129EFDC3|nr:protein mono-ADP-ribosyltransferase PARP10 [Phasianus colchicus]